MDTNAVKNTPSRIARKVSPSSSFSSSSSISLFYEYEDDDEEEDDLATTNHPCNPWLRFSRAAKPISIGAPGCHVASVTRRAGLPTLLTRHFATLAAWRPSQPSWLTSDSGRWRNRSRSAHPAFAHSR